MIKKKRDFKVLSVKLQEIYTMNKLETQDRAQDSIVIRDLIKQQKHISS